MKILCITDIHGNRKGLPRVLGMESDSDLIILGGDITHLGGYKQAEEILAPVLESHIKLFAVHGNMDRKGAVDYLKEKDLTIHGRCIREEGMFFIGLGGCNPSPFLTPHEYSDIEAKKILSRALTGMTGEGRRILISHAPPENTHLDMLKNGSHVGSGVVRKIITDYAIDFCVCGHIHESPGVDKIGECVCVNPGEFGKGHYAVAEITDNSINVIRRYI
jgi:uncharacterized protein